MSGYNPNQARCMFCGDTGQVFKRSLAHKLAAEISTELDIKSDAILEAVAEVWVRVKLDNIPNNPEEAANHGMELLADALRRYARDLRKGELV